jgi:N6-L-threonylcarbamoyladenine synthase
MKILAIDTSCDETSAAVTQDLKVLSNIIWSQASAHAKFGGVMPSLAQRMHEERIDFVIQKALSLSKSSLSSIDAISVTIGPGLSIALGVGVNKAKELALKYNKKLIAVNHLEGHLLGPLANNKYPLSSIKYPSLGLVISGGNTILVKINKNGDYETIAQTSDDALGEALDKAARMLGLGYPGGAILEKVAREGAEKSFNLPIPIVGHEDRKMFTYSGLKTALMRLVESQKPLTKEKIQNLAASFQNVAFEHLVRVSRYCITHSNTKFHSFFIGGGVAANVEIRKRLRKMGKENNLDVLFPYSTKLYGDNAAMIGIVACFKAKRKEFIDTEKIDRNPNLKVGQ